jgi:hypothetical protein
VGFINLKVWGSGHPQKIIDTRISVLIIINNNNNNWCVKKKGLDEKCK